MCIQGSTVTKLFCELEEGLKGKAHLMHMKKAHQYDFQPSLVNFTNRETMGNFMQKKKAFMATRK